MNLDVEKFQVVSIERYKYLYMFFSLENPALPELLNAVILYRHLCFIINTKLQSHPVIFNLKIMFKRLHT